MQLRYVWIWVESLWIFLCKGSRNIDCIHTLNNFRSRVISESIHSVFVLNCGRKATWNRSWTVINRFSHLVFVSSKHTSLFLRNLKSPPVFLHLTLFIVTVFISLQKTEHYIWIRSFFIMGFPYKLCKNGFQLVFNSDEPFRPLMNQREPMQSDTKA